MKMTSRRDMLRAGIAASTLPFAAPAAGLAAAFGDFGLDVYEVLYDTRFPASVEFARRAAANGQRIVATNGDITRVWYDDLYHRWRAGPAAVAGLTAHGALFCLAELARAERMRVVFRAEHSAVAAGGVAHAIEGDAGLLAVAVAAAASACWPAAMADVVARCPAERSEWRRARAFTPASVEVPGEPLYSWIIAPIGRQGVLRA
jgi:hypothetical protein